jgi:hypothetical protein
MRPARLHVSHSVGQALAFVLLLESLALSSNALDPAGVAALAERLHCVPGLQTLNLGFNAPLGLIALASLCNVPSRSVPKLRVRSCGALRVCCALRSKASVRGGALGEQTCRI